MDSEDLLLEENAEQRNALILNKDHYQLSCVASCCEVFAIAMIAMQRVNSSFTSEPASFEDGVLMREEFMILAQDFKDNRLWAAMSGDITREFNKARIDMAEYQLNYTADFIDQSAIAEYIPEGLKNERAVDLLEVYGAPNLATLCNDLIT